jgi:hypothetical protein
VYWRVVEDLRVEFEGFRAVVRDDRKALTGNSPAFVQRYASHLRDAVVAPKLAGSAAEAVGGVAAAAGPVGVLGPAVGIAAKLAAKFGIQALRRGFDRLVRPDVYVLNNVADEARHLAELEEVIQRLWGQEWKRADYETLERLSRSQPFAALQLAYHH